MKLNILVVQFLTTVALYSEALASNECCSGKENVITNQKKCSDGTFVTLTCRKYLYRMTKGISTFRIEENNDLTVDDVYNQPTFTIESGSYCLSRLNDSDEEIALICFNQQEHPFFELRGICALISVVFFIFVLLVYAIVPSLRDLQGKCTMHAIAALATSYIFLTLLQFHVGYESRLACEILAFVTYYFFLAAFFWLNVICFHVWRASVYPTMTLTKKSLYRLSLCYGYGFPTLLLIIIITTHHVPGRHVKPGFGDNACWFKGETAQWLYFYIPVTIILIINVILFCWTAKVLWNSIIHQRTSRLKALRHKFALYVKLSVVMGLTWIFEILSMLFYDSKTFIRYVWSVFDYVNILQGFLIFLVLVVFRKRALKGIAQRGLLCNKWKHLEDEESENTDVLPSLHNADELKELNCNGKEEKSKTTI